MTTTTENKEIIAELNSKINYTEESIKKMTEKLMENYTSNFSWVGEELWNSNWKLNHYKAILADIVEKQYNWVDVKKHWSASFRRFVSESYNVRENSTGALHREVSTWKFICNMDLLNWIENI